MNRPRRTALALIWAWVSIAGGVVLKELEEGICVGGDGGFCGGEGMAVVRVRESRIIQLDGAGGAGDVLEIGSEGVEEDTLADGAAELTDTCGGEFGKDGIEIAEERGGPTFEGEIGRVDAAKGLNTGGASEAADVTVVHGMRWFGLLCRMNDLEVILS
jgi:hypothetical protein